MMKMILMIAMGPAALAGVAAPRPARAAHPLMTDDAATLGRRVVQVELGSAVSRDRSRAGDGTRTREDAAEVVLAVGAGLRGDLDLTLGVPLAGARTVAEGDAAQARGGLGDLTLDLKWRAMEAGGLAVALRPGVTLPTGDARRGLGTGRACFAATLIVSQELGPVSLHANLAYLRDAYAGSADRRTLRADRLRASAATVLEVTPTVRLAADAGAERDPDRSEDAWGAHALGAALVAVSPRVDLDAGVKVGLTAPATDVTALFGLTCRF